MRRCDKKILRMVRRKESENEPDVITFSPEQRAQVLAKSNEIAVVSGLEAEFLGDAMAVGVESNLSISG